MTFRPMASHSTSVAVRAEQREDMNVSVDSDNATSVEDRHGRAHWFTSRLPSFVLIAIGLVFLVPASQLELGASTAPGPGLWPTIASAAVVVLGTLSAIWGDGSIEAMSTSKSEYLRAGLAFSQALLSVAAFWLFGYFAGAFLIVLLMSKTFSDARWSRVLALALTFGVVMHVFFGIVLGLPAPTSPL